MLLLADTSVWIDHFRRGDVELAYYLEANMILMHPFVRGELALGSIKDRLEKIRLMRDLEEVMIPTTDEVDVLIEREGLFGRGIGYVDAHLVASVKLTPDALLWTRDKRLRSVADQFGIAAPIG